MPGGVRGVPGFSQAQRCDRFVHIRDGVFYLDNAPWAFKSVNFRMAILGKEVAPGAPTQPGTPRVTVAGKALDLFLTPEAYSPDNNSWCRDPDPTGSLVCCRDRATCSKDLADEVARLRGLGVNSVRLLMDTFKFVNGVPTFAIGRMPWVWNQDFGLDMRDATHRDAVVLLHRRAVQFLGMRGVRSLILLNGHPVFKDRPAENAAYTAFTAALAANLKDEPFLVGFDFVNEPSWIKLPAGVTNFSIDKAGARDLVKTWVNAVRVAGGNKRALLTIGNAHVTTSLETWDPAFLPLDFNSYHLYPPSPITWPGSQAWVARETFYASVGGCGVRCWTGKYDGANCLVNKGPVGTTGRADKDGSFLYRGRTSTCAAGASPKGECVAARFVPGRDRPFVLPQTLLYLKAKSGSCPAGSRYDGANCLVAETPPGAKTFMYGQGAARSFYYGHLSTTPGKRCQAPARDDGANCQVAKIPVGWEPFVLSRPLFYVAANNCGGGRIPYIIGEFGTSVHEMNVTTGAVSKPSHGDAANQGRYLKGVADLAHACGYQGVQWWQFGDVHWGDVVQDHFGLWGDFRQVHPGQPVPTPDAMAMRPAGEVLRDQVNLLAPRPVCSVPADIQKPIFGPSVPSKLRFRYRGTVTDKNGNPVPFALLRARLSGGGPDVYFDAFADGKGKYDFKTPRLLEKIKASHFGHHTSRWYIPVPLIPKRLRMQRATAADLPTYAPPSSNEQACRQVVY